MSESNAPAPPDVPDAPPAPPGPPGTAVESVAPGGAAQRAGVRPGDVLLELNGIPVRDIIDYMFALEGPVVKLKLKRGSRSFNVEFPLKEGQGAGGVGLGLRHFRIRRCRNKCAFCFVSQLPRGLRQSLYVKDEDYRASFLYGNYVTLTNLSDADRGRIIEQRLSPLYVSVHSTDRETRNRMLGNPRAADVMQELRTFAEAGICFHTQIVLCPGTNDGEMLKKTLTDLASLCPAVLSIAVVPVGLTSHQRANLAPVEKEDARLALGVINEFRKGFKEGLREALSEALVQGSDELYIKAGRPFPPLEEYGDLPQIENGVGMVPLFLSEASELSLPSKVSPEKFLTFTGVSFKPFLQKFVARLNRRGARVELVPVQNRLFGPSVTVTGLLTGRDIIDQLRPHTDGRDALLMPNCVLRDTGDVSSDTSDVLSDTSDVLSDTGDVSSDTGDVLLDDTTPAEVEDALGIKVIIIEPTPQGLAEAIKK